jgi:ceramide glucosyltransferase
LLHDDRMTYLRFPQYVPAKGLARMSIVVYTLAALGLAQALLLWLWTYENTRFFRSRLRSRVTLDFVPRAHLFMPCKGVEPRFVDTVRGMLAQDYPHYRVTFVVESPDDPAYAHLSRLIAADSHRDGSNARAELVIAGGARDCGQKVHNLLTATDRLDDQAEVVVFADSDILPDNQWLRRLVSPLSRDKTGVVTGYRWFCAQPGDWSGTLLAALNSSVTFSLGNHPWNQVWGGSWAIRRQTFEELRAAALWHGALTEDLQVSRFVRERGGYVAFEPSCLVASPVQGGWRVLAEFARRQYLITRVYAPRFWWLGLLATLFAQIVFWSSAAIALVGWWRGEPWPALSLVIASIYVIHTIRAVMRQRAVRLRFPEQTHTQRAVAWLDTLGHPLLGMLQLLLIVSSAFGRSITWRSIRYRLHGPHRTEIVRGRRVVGV